MQINQNKHFNRIKSESIPWPLCNKAIIYTKHHKHVKEWNGEENEDEDEDEESEDESSEEEQENNIDDSYILEM